MQASTFDTFAPPTHQNQKSRPTGTFEPPRSRGRRRSFCRHRRPAARLAPCVARCTSKSIYDLKRCSSSALGKAHWLAPESRWPCLTRASRSCIANVLCFGPRLPAALAAIPPRLIHPARSKKLGSYFHSAPTVKMPNAAQKSHTENTTSNNPIIRSNQCPMRKKRWRIPSLAKIRLTKKNQPALTKHIQPP